MSARFRCGRPPPSEYLKSLSSGRRSATYLFLSRNNRPISRAALDDLIKRYGAKAKLPEDRRHFHILKHSIAMHMVAAGSDVLVVRDWLGHKSIQNTLVYAPAPLAKT